MNHVSISEIDDVDGINKLLREFYFDMHTDQTEGNVLQLKKYDGLHIIEASGDGKHGYFYTIDLGDNEVECHAVIERESRGSWGVKAALAAIGYVSKVYGVKKFHSSQFSHTRHAGVFLNKLGFSRDGTFSCGHTRDHYPVNFSTYTLEV